MEVFFATCPRGLEAVLAAELSALGAGDVLAARAGVAFSGAWALAYRANLWSRLASRILWRVHHCRYRDERDIYGAAHALDWPRWFDVTRSIAVSVTARRAPLKSLDFITLRIKDAICDRFRAAGGARPNVNARAPDVGVFAFLDQAEATFYLDTSGEALFKRGYRADQTQAPLKENLAAGIVRLSGWQAPTALVDPMCGGGTLLIEAALIALNIAPGLQREFGFMKLHHFDRATFERLRTEAQAARCAAPELTMMGFDRQVEALRLANRAAKSAGVDELIKFVKQDALEVSAPAPSGTLITNPPYGVRMGEPEALAQFYPRFGDALKQRFAGWRACIFSADERLPKLIGLKAARRTPLYNGAIECRLYDYPIVAGAMPQRRRATADQTISK